VNPLYISNLDFQKEHLLLRDLILEHTGKVTTNRMLDTEQSKMENSVVADGKAKGGVNITMTVTYWNIQCGDGLSYGEGHGVITTKNDRGNDVVKVTEYGVGKSHGPKTICRGSSFYQTSLNNKLSFLHGMVGVFETEVDASGNVIEKVWEWK
jgi:hypothetical protein